MGRDDDLEEQGNTGNGFDRDQAATTHLLLKKSVKDIRDLKEFTLSLIKNQELTTTSLNSLIKVIESLDKKNEDLQIKFFILSVITGVLALTQLIVALIPFINKMSQ